MKRGAIFPPLAAMQLGPKLFLTDGFHRAEAMKLNHETSANVMVLPGGSIEEARCQAGLANLSHGRPLKAKEIREVFRAFVRAGRHRQKGRKGPFKSYREIATELGGRVAHSTIRNWMRRYFRTTWVAMGTGDDAPRAKGGLRDRRTKPDQFLVRETEEALEFVLAGLSGIEDPEARFTILKKVQEIARRLETAGVKEPPF